MAIRIPIWVDPPEGHRYGFPMVYRPEEDGNILEWLTTKGYPNAENIPHIRCWPAEEDE